ncbi:uncharacterized protein [Clinocottus analis]|uniref:uncharacterized protein n=1 Tax=Clinocottus analis TaxID=304258 RepID=UPI0035BFB9BD
MNAGRWIVLLALGFICVSSNEEPDIENSCAPHLDVCETNALRAPLGSSVLLQCSFNTTNRSWVSWAQTTGLDLVQLRTEGRIKFLDHRNGRVKVFPNQASEGNYSILIDELQHSDHGCYRCKQGHDCHQVELGVAVEGAPSEDWMLLIYICVGVTAFTLLSVGGYCCAKCILCCNRTIYSINNPEGAAADGARAAPVETGRAPVEPQQRGGGNDNLVYENDDQNPFSLQGDLSGNYCNSIDLPNPDSTQPTASGIYPNLNQFQTVESPTTKQSFHRELFSRLRQASMSRHYYANQGEISKHQATATPAQNHHGAAGFGKKKKKKAETNVELQNPIYNRSADQLNL